MPATSHNQNGASITTKQWYKYMCGRHIFLRNNRFRMTSCGLQAEGSSLHAHMTQPLLLPGGCLHYNWCWKPKLGYPWFLKQPLLHVTQKKLIMGWVGGTKKINFSSPLFCYFRGACDGPSVKSSSMLDKINSENLSSSHLELLLFSFVTFTIRILVFAFLIWVSFK